MCSQTQLNGCASPSCFNLQQLSKVSVSCFSAVSSVLAAIILPGWSSSLLGKNSNRTVFFLKSQIILKSTTKAEHVTGDCPNLMMEPGEL